MGTDVNSKRRRKRIDPAIQAHIQELRNERPFSGFTDDGAEPPYRLRILGRGELAFYEERGRALLFELIAGRGLIFTKTMRLWDDGYAVTDEDRKRIAGRIEAYLRSKGADSVTIV